MSTFSCRNSCVRLAKLLKLAGMVPTRPLHDKPKMSRAVPSRVHCVPPCPQLQGSSRSREHSVQLGPPAASYRSAHAWHCSGARPALFPVHVSARTIASPATSTAARQPRAPRCASPRAVLLALWVRISYYCRSVPEFC